LGEGIVMSNTNPVVDVVALDNDCGNLAVIKKMFYPGSLYYHGDKLVITQSHTLYDDGAYQPPATIELRGVCIKRLYRFLHKHYGSDKSREDYLEYHESGVDLKMGQE
jgi:hypothetical protein